MTAITKISQMAVLPGLTGAEYVPVIVTTGNTITNARAQVSQFNITGGAVSSAQSANTVFAGPLTGAPAFPAFRSFGSLDLPNPVLQFGGADAAAPVAQTLQVQNVLAGTSNTAGALLTIKGSASTGNAAGGDILFQGSVTGSSGTTQNAFFNILRISPSSALGAGASLTMVDQNTGSFRIILNSNNVGMGASAVMQAAFLENSAQVGFALGGDQLLGWSSANASTTVLGGMDTMMGRVGAATIRLGAVDAAAPVAQTLSVQNVVAGTSNTAGQNLTIKGSAGTGTGAGGNIIFQTAPAGGSGTTQNAFATGLTVTTSFVTSPYAMVANNTTAVPAGGATSTGFFFSSGAGFGFFFGSGAPTVSAAQGSLYLRSDGSSPWVNTSGSTTWFDYGNAASYFIIRLVGVNFNSANTDTTVNVTLPAGFTRYRIADLEINHASASITTATFGVFSASGGGGTAIFTSGTAITVSTASENTNNNAQLVSAVTNTTQSWNLASFFFRVQTAQGSAATADVTFHIVPLT